MARLIVRKEQMDVMQAVADANFERQIAGHLREAYPDAAVKLPEGDETVVSALIEEKLERLVRSGVAKARRYEMSLQSSISAFVALMFDVAPNFDEHRLCGVLLGDEEKAPDERIDDVLSVLTEKNWDAIRKDYDAQAWVLSEPEAADQQPEKAKAASADPMGKTMSGKTMSGKTMSGKTLSGGKTMARTMARKSQTIRVQPEVPDTDTEFDQKTMKVDRPE